ncbi:hypothetical protein LZP69_09575 [Shewanella sp. AS1]|uniref:CLCA_X family protein n=1 Tax=Shewanella sp. AS1 TaxID=2907626 RepID=UPI001F1BBF22|nr:CLCA_X family protein [Shewanella sp. AS1]MCE9679421.1 hypothetical protein [Shewanella sp. AS1]
MLKRYRDQRRGPDYRQGEQVSFNDIKQVFGLNHIRLGSWVDEEEKHKAANFIFDALADLAYILKLPPMAIGLRQSLNLAFGSGGQPGVQAHYMPPARELALAKNAGAGALAHEFWHAFDHYIASKAYRLDCAATTFASSCWLNDVPTISHPLNQRLEALFQTSLLTADGQDSHDYVKRAVALDKQYGRYYFAHPSELMARAFEACIEVHPEVYNPYLVNETLDSELARAGGYPDPEHRQQIFLQLLNYFAPLGEALQRE